MSFTISLFRATAGVILVLCAATPARPQGDTAGTITWVEAGRLPHARDHHATVAVSAGAAEFLYVIGGTNYKELYPQVAGARVLADGSLAPWREGPALPSPRGGLSAVWLQNVVVVTGGQIDTATALRGLKRIPDVLVARVQPDGMLGAWQPAVPLPRPRFHHPVVAHNGWIYVIGGQGEKEAESGVFAARLTEQGTITQWIEVQPLPRARSHHAAFVADDHVYVVGGLDGVVAGHNAHFFDVIRAPIRGDGTLGEWRIVSRMPNAYATHAAFAHAGFLWVIGGVENGAVFTDAIWRAPILTDLRIGAWSKFASPLPVGRGHVHNTPVVKGRIYSAGGRVAAAAGPAVIDAVHAGELR